MGKITETSMDGSVTVTDESGESYSFPAPSTHPLLLEIDPRIDLTKPIYEQVVRLAALDRKIDEAEAA